MQHSPAAHGSHAADDAGHHVMSPGVLIGTFLALIGLTILTVGSSYFPLGHWDVVVAMAVATVKALLVAVFFMHLRYDKPLNSLLLVFSLFFVALFIGLTLIDSEQYQPEIIAAEPVPTTTP